MSSSDLAVSVRGLSKSYTIAHNSAKHTSAAEAIVHKIKNPRQRAETETFWALKDVEFDIAKGDVVGIVGRNGAGKSTLLKILSRITEPTTGQIDLYGRVGSLLEVGTGFHPELTGRENIYLNGAILGMNRREIAKQFDAIVDFAGVEKFLDTPVKRYSSGMYVRLAFAVAAHLRSEILIIDEVLAVGDAEFQRKCLGKMQDVAHSGRTVLFVSHNMSAINNLCTTCLVFENGRIGCAGPTSDAIEFYVAANRRGLMDRSLLIETFRPSWAQPLITSARLLDSTGREQASFPMGSDIIVEVTFDAGGDTIIRAPVVGVVIHHAVMGTVGGINSRMSGYWPSDGPYQSGVMRCRLTQVPFLQGRYSVELWLGDGPTDLDAVNGYLGFEIEERDVYGTGHPPFSHCGTIYLQSTWELSALAPTVAEYASSR